MAKQSRSKIDQTDESFAPATNLEDVLDATTERPLAGNDPRYVDLRAARGGEDTVRRLERHLRQAVRSDLPRLTLLTGHKGVGKSTELRRL